MVALRNGSNVSNVSVSEVEDASGKGAFKEFKEGEDEWRTWSRRRYLSGNGNRVRVGYKSWVIIIIRINQGVS